MAKTPNDARDDRITIPQMRETIRRSGYLLEERIRAVMESNGFDAEANVAYFDDKTQKSRELDIEAHTDFPLWEDEGKEAEDWVSAQVLCEAENNYQPVVFFQANVQLGPLPLLGGIPAEIWVSRDGGKDRYLLVNFREPFPQHHYQRVPVATQYCIFRHPARSPKSWIADHAEDQHATFDKLVMATESAMSRYRRYWEVPQTPEAIKVDLSLYYPTLVLQGLMFLAREAKGKLTFRKTPHVVYERQLSTEKHHRSYPIDVVQEAYLPTYLEIVKREARLFRNEMRHQRSLLEGTLEQMHSELGRDREKWRPYLR